MNLSMTTVQGLKSFAGIALAGLGFDAASGHLSPILWFLVREVFSLLFWGAQEGLKVPFPIQMFSSLACPFQLLVALTPLLRTLAGAV
jgi:hypothetical protein